MRVEMDMFGSKAAWCHGELSSRARVNHYQMRASGIHRDREVRAPKFGRPCTPRALESDSRLAPYEYLIGSYLSSSAYLCEGVASDTLDNRARNNRL
jgi:hypothetical protein